MAGSWIREHAHRAYWPGPPRPEHSAWYFSSILGVSLAVLLAMLNAMWGEMREQRGDAKDD